MQSALSQAVVLYLGWGSAPSPRQDQSQLVRQFGVLRGAELEREVKSLLEQVNQIDVDWTIYPLESAGELVRSYLQSSHPDLTDAAVDALVWKFTFDWR